MFARGNSAGKSASISSLKKRGLVLCADRRSSGGDLNSASLKAYIGHKGSGYAQACSMLVKQEFSLIQETSGDRAL
ncbi:hypothetical protein EON65_57940 [archaeon]|nr:MAG: hypothetical protein EON65_57940 [archaeon]